MNNLNDAVKNLLTYIESESYRGYDPYDALLSPLFRFPFLRTNKTLQFYSQQFVKRCPVNVRPLLLIHKGYNPVTLGLCIQSYANLMLAFPEKKEEYQKRAVLLISELKSLVPKGFSGACWGYDFPWQARYAAIPAWQPTIVATGIITNALYFFYKAAGFKEALELCKSASGFVLNDLRRTYHGTSLCFSYSPFDEQQVYNASAKAIRLLAQVYSETKDEKLVAPMKNAVDYIVNRQQPDGSWFYSDVGKWVDNYHTGYILDCLDEYMNVAPDRNIRQNLQNGFAFYKKNFFSPNGMPGLMINKYLPVDCTAAGQSLLTLVRFGDVQTALKTADWMIRNMQSEKGFFYYRKGKYFTRKTSFMRWSNAWMFTGLTCLLMHINKK